MTGETGEAELLIAFFASVFIDMVSYAFVLRGRVQGEELSAVNDDLVSDYLQELSPTWDHGTRQAISKGMREMAHCKAAFYCILKIMSVNASMSWFVIPRWLNANIAHIFRKVKRTIQGTTGQVNSLLSQRKSRSKSSGNKFLGTGIRRKWLWQSACSHQWVHHGVNHVWLTSSSVIKSLDL